jgi:acyl carrier protein
MIDMTQSLEAPTEQVGGLLVAAMRRKLQSAGISTAGVDETTPLIDLGLIDSQALLDIILEVEDRCGLSFDPLRIDLESHVTLERIATAFTAEIS